MRPTPYFSVRTGQHPTDGRLDWAGLTHLFRAVYQRFYGASYFAETIGSDCVDAGFIPGRAGEDTEAFFFQKLRKRNLWPVHASLAHYTEADLFDVVELLYDCASKGIEGHGFFHAWNGCGWHFDKFDKSAGRADFRNAMNELLAEYGPGYELTLQGEIVFRAPEGLVDLEEAPQPPSDPENVQERLRQAIGKFRRRGASFEARKDAIRDLADILEYLRPSAKTVLQSKDEADLFALANNFGVRHHNQKQKTDYDRGIWYSWMFYYFLATIHASTRLIAKAKESPPSDGQV